MDIRFGLTGSERKALVAAISEVVGEQAVYCGAPTFAYEVDGYCIDKEGTLSGPDSPALLDSLAALGYVNPESGGADDNDDAQELIIEFPKEGFDEDAIARLEKLIASKATLLRRALVTDTLDVRQTATTLQFPWFTTTGTPAESEAYARLVFALCNAAREQKRVTAREKPVDNEKYAFRCFLLRLGFIGKECKQARKILLRNLSGNSSFKSGERKPKDDAQEEAQALPGAPQTL